jgi:DNA-binding transcriptional regulator YdaS (Cro superfamily)
MMRMSKVLTPEDRRRIAEAVGVNPATLYQAITAKGAGFAPAECVRIERESGRELRRWDLRPKDWDLIWPELIGAEGAPPLPKARRRLNRARA